MSLEIAPGPAHVVDAYSLDSCLDLAIVVPTYNERDNVAELISRIADALGGLRWELIFVDDDSPDGTAEVIRRMARCDARIRLLHRVGRRGLSSACVEGALATSANSIAVMDADMQHDERILPEMLRRLRSESLDVVVGTRNGEGGSMGQFSAGRRLLSRAGEAVSHVICRSRVSDPMSGFFIVSRSFFEEVMHDLQGSGFKILVDMLASSQRTVRFAEVGYCFRSRIHGESKLDFIISAEYLFLILNKLMGGLIPLRFALFSLVGATGVLTYLIVLAVSIRGFHLHFFPAQVVATYTAMTENFFLNKLLTYRERSLRGAYLLPGLASFWVACSFGAWANFVVSHALLVAGRPWYFAGLAGIVLSSVWNYSMSSLFTWQMPSSRRDAYAVGATPALRGDVELTR